MSGLSGVPDNRLLVLLARGLKAQMTHPVGSELWADAVRDYADCQREYDGRLLLRIVKATGGALAEDDDEGDSI